MKMSKGEKIFNIFNISLLGLLAFSCLYPFLYVLNLSLASAAQASKEGLRIFPSDINWASYEIVFANDAIITGFVNTIIRTVIGTILTLLATCIAAYPLARPEMPHRSMFAFIILFTMIFSGGMIPTYILIQKLGLINSMWSLIIPALITPFNVIIMKNFFQGIPESLAESAKIDGANDFIILFKIYIPLSMPVIATVALWTAVGHWNAWFDALLYINDESKQVLQVLLQRIVIESSSQLLEMGVTNTSVTAFTPETVKAATIIVTVLPILIVYPALQRFFVKGVSLGGVKE